MLLKTTIKASPANLINNTEPQGTFMIQQSADVWESKLGVC